MSREHIPTKSGQYALRMSAADLIREATERGDLDQRTVAWAATRLLQRADSVPAFIATAKVCPACATTDTTRPHAAATSVAGGLA